MNITPIEIITGLLLFVVIFFLQLINDKTEKILNILFRMKYKIDIPPQEEE
jgi:hypothetical protein